MAELLDVFGEISQRIINLVGQKILAIIQSGHFLGLGSHTPKPTGFLPVRQPLSFM